MVQICNIKKKLIYTQESISDVMLHVPKNDFMFPELKL